MDTPTNNDGRRARCPQTPARIQIPDAAWPGIGAYCAWSERELEIARLLFAGLKEHAIERRLKISFGTVDNTVAHLYAKMHVHTRADFALAVMAAHLEIAKQAGRALPPPN